MTRAFPSLSARLPRPGWASLTLTAALLGAASLPAHATDLQWIPTVGVGTLDGGHVTQAGMRVMLKSNATQSYGLEWSTLHSARAGRYQVAGIVLEQRVLGWVDMGIGTVAYMQQGGARNRSPGLVANLGWQGSGTGPLPFVSWRNDFIFGQRTLHSTSLSAGVKLSW